MASTARIVSFARTLTGVLGVSPLLIVGVLAGWLSSHGADAGDAISNPTQETLLGISLPLQQLLLATLPLVAATATVVYAWREDWLASGSLGIAQVALIVVCYFAAVGILEWQSAVEPVALVPEPNGVLGMMARAVNYVAGSAAAYGIWRFGAALLTGILLGYVWHDRVTKLKLAWQQSRQPLAHDQSGSSSS